MDEFWDGVLKHVETAVMLPLCLLAVFVVHELGHYLAARVLSLRVDSVTFGRGRLIWSRTDSNGTLWKLHLWPLHAHVQIAEFENTGVLSLSRKLFVVFGGAACKSRSAFLFVSRVFSAFGKPAIPNIVTAVEPAMPAYKAGLRPGDKILSIDGEEVQSMDDILAHTYPRHSAPFTVAFNRQGEIREVQVQPVWTRYRNLDGVMREHGRIGLSTYQQAYNLEIVRSVAGIPTRNVDEARTALLQHLGERIEIGLWSMDGKVYVSVVDLSSEANKHLGNLKHKESKKFYMGTLRDNLYLRMSVPKSVVEAASRNATMLGHAVRLPFNLFPIDKEWITPDAVVSRENSFIGMRVYIFVFFTSLCSCLIGLLNLLPFPRLDGSAALLMAGEAFKHRPLSSREKAATIVFSLLFIYAAIFGANAIDIRGYLTFQMQKASASEP